MFLWLLNCHSLFGWNTAGLPSASWIWIGCKQLAHSVGGGFSSTICLFSSFSCECYYIIVWFCSVLQGGGWCNTIRNCVYRKTTRRGSSKFMEKQLPFTGILSNKPEENPGMECTLFTSFVCYIEIFGSSCLHLHVWLQF